MSADIFTIILFVLWSIFQVRAVARVVAAWQRKEYRYDRMRSDWGMPGRFRLIIPSILKTILVITLFLWSTYMHEVLVFLYGVGVCVFVYEIWNHRVSRPNMTHNAIGLLLLSFVSIVGAGFMLLRIPQYLLVLDIVTPIVVTGFVACLWPLVRISRNRIMSKAVSKRTSVSNLTVIGITGSYGKSGTKHFLQEILESEHTIVTPGNVNSEIGVAQFLASNLQSDTSRAVLEMGAYKAGEIARMASVANPNIGIITAVASQHLSLFGSREALSNAKYELIESLPKNGTAIFNADCPGAFALAKKTNHCNVITYSVNDRSADYYATNASLSPEGTYAHVHTPKRTVSVHIPLLGAHVLQNALAAIAAADALGISLDTVHDRLETIAQQPRTMERIELPDNTILIDDSYSANPEGARSAIHTLSLFSDMQKIVVMQPMIELGKESEQSHVAVGKALGNEADIVLYAGTEYADAIRRGIASVGNTTEFRAVRERDIPRIIEQYRAEGTVILLEGRIPRTAWEYFRNNTPSDSSDIFTELAPNTFKEDAISACRLLVRPHKYRSGAATKELVKTFRHRLGAPRAVAVTSGRYAIELALRSSDISPKSEVVLQAYTCVSVPGPILWAGLTPVYADIREGTFAMDPEDFRKKITPNTKAVIIQHTFGIPAPIDELIAIAREHGLIVIEDCAHAIGATFRNQEIGTFGDAAIFSFGRDKAMSSTFGGMLVINQPKRFPHIDNEINKLTETRVPGRWVFQQLLHPILFTWCIRPLYFRLGIGKILLVLFQKIGILSKAVAFDERKGKPPPFPRATLPNALACMALLQYKRIPGWNRRRNGHAARYRSLAVSHPVIPDGAVPAFLRYPVLVEDPGKIRKNGLENRIMLGNWYNAAIAPAGVDVKTVQYTSGSCPVAEEAAKHSLNLPVHPVLSYGQHKRVVSFIEHTIRSEQRS